MIWVYAICERPELPPPRRRGLAQAPLDGVREGALLSVVTRHVHPPADPALDALWVHDRVIERLMADRAVLPMRFGSRLADDAALRDLLAARQEAFLAALDRVRGRVELGLRALRRAPGPGDGGRARPAAPRVRTGHDYLLSRLGTGRQVEQAAAHLHDALRALSSDARRLPARAPDELVRAAYLVDRDVVPRFRATVERLQREHPEASILCTGPWPAYSFVTAPRPPRTPAPTAGPGRRRASRPRGRDT
jgi:hypothetical protein